MPKNLNIVEDPAEDQNDQEPADNSDAGSTGPESVATADVAPPAEGRGGSYLSLGGGEEVKVEE